MKEMPADPLRDELLPPPEVPDVVETSIPPTVPDKPPMETLPKTKIAAEGLTVKEKNVKNQTIEKPAEPEQPLEVELERRHEIKDRVKDEPMVPLSAVVADIPKRQPAMAYLQTQASEDLPSIEGIKDEPDSPSGEYLTYKRAVRLGFISGTVIMVIFGAVYLIMR